MCSWVNPLVCSFLNSFANNLVLFISYTIIPPARFELASSGREPPVIATRLSGLHSLLLLANKECADYNNESVSEFFYFFFLRQCFQSSGLVPYILGT